MSKGKDYGLVGVGIFVGVLLMLQLFLLTVGLEGLLIFDAGLSWASAALSTALAVMAFAIYKLFPGR